MNDRVVILPGQRFLAFAIFVVALAPATAFATSYLPGQTLNPSCLPTDSTCIVTALPITTGDILFGNGTATAATSSSLFWDNVHGRLGIGTTSPTAILTLDSSSPTGTVMRVSNSSAGGHIYDWLSTGSGNTGGAGRLDLFDFTAGAARLSIAANGNVGVGTTSPFTSFAVNGSAYLNGNLNVSDAATTRSNLGLAYATGSLATNASFNIVAWGDSLTQGAGGATPFTTFLSSDLGGRPVLNQGIGGQTSTQIAARMLAAPSMSNWTTIIWAGRNDNNLPATVESNIANMVSSLGSNTHYLILPILNGEGEGATTTAYSQIMTINNYLASTYPNHYYDIREYLIQHGLSDAGITPTAQDTWDMSADIVPTSLHGVGDFLHPNTAGNQVIGRQVANFIQANLDTAIQTTILTPSSLPSVFANPFAIGTNNQSYALFTSVSIATSSTSTPAFPLDVYGAINTNSVVGGYYMDGSPLLSASSSLNTFVLGGRVGSSVTGIDNDAFGALLVVTSGSDNDIFGKQAFNNGTTGSSNIAIGSYALRFNTTGNQNTAIGAEALYNNISGSGNTAIGYLSLMNATSSRETAIGWEALQNDACGTVCFNTAVGWSALSANTYGTNNIAIGSSALANNTTGNQNTAIGALAANTTGINNVGIGGSLGSATAAIQNVGIGLSALRLTTTGSNNVAIGAGDNSAGGNLSSNTTGSQNVSIGSDTLTKSTTGSGNVAIGGGTGVFWSYPLWGNNSATSTVAIGTGAAAGNDATYHNQGGVYLGYLSGYNAGTGSDYNTLLGYQSGYGLTTGNHNIFLGDNSTQANANETTGSSNIKIGDNITLPSGTASNQLDIGNFIYGTGFGGTGSAVSNGLLGIGTTTPFSRLEVWGPDTASTTAFLVANSASTTEFAVYDTGNATLAGGLIQNSDQRLKTNIQSLDASSSLSLIDQLNPVTFNWIDPNKGSTQQLGFIAQQVLPIFPNLVATTSPTALTPDGTLSLNYIDLVSPIVSAIQALSADVSSAENAITGFADSFTTRQLTFVRGQGTEIDVQKLCIGSTCITEDQLKALLTSSNQSSASGSPSSSDSSATSSVAESPPVISINGDNPAVVQIGAAYNDLGATITGPQADLNLGITTFLNGTLTSNIVIDASAAATDTIDYVATDQNGLTATSTRTVIVEASPAIAPTDNASTTTDATTTAQ